MLVHILKCITIFRLCRKPHDFHQRTVMSNHHLTPTQTLMEVEIQTLHGGATHLSPLTMSMRTCLVIKRMPMSLRAVPMMKKRWLLNQCSTTQATHNQLVKCNSQQMYPFYQALPPQSILRKKVNEIEFSSVPYLVVCASEYVNIYCVLVLYI